MSLLLGCIADDFTGATDLANTLVLQGLKVVQVIGVPETEFALADAEAVVVALKSRTAPVEQAVAESLAALEWLRSKGAVQFFFKYCSTFDSTDKGNIGPVTEALLAALGEKFTIACPAFPTNGRTLYQGHLFVGNQLLSESGMKDHPLTPMKDANLVEVLGRQTSGRVGLVPWTLVSEGSEAIRHAFDVLQASGVSHAIVDAITDEDLFSIGRACRELKLITGGSGVAMGLPENCRQAGDSVKEESRFPLDLTGREAVLAGSCSQATLAQIENFRQQWPSFAVDAIALSGNDQLIPEILDWAESQLAAGPLLIYSSASPAEVLRIQSIMGREAAGELVEHAMGKIAAGLVQLGVRRLVVAGGETSGAVVKSLGIRAMAIGPEIAPGVPWCRTIGEPSILLALKSGNFGGEGFFQQAFGMLS